MKYKEKNLIPNTTANKKLNTVVDITVNIDKKQNITANQKFNSIADQNINADIRQNNIAYQ